MALNQGGLNSIESISGLEAVSTSAVEGITLPNSQNSDYDFTKPAPLNNQTNFLTLTRHGNTVNFSSNTINNMFGDQNYVGGNMLASIETMQNQYNDKGAAYNVFTMA